jgi:uncharacterized protein (DUF1697 family)
MALAPVNHSFGQEKHMPRYVAFLRGVSPMNAKMSEPRACFEKAGFTNVKTVLSSGNIIFTSPLKKEASLIKDIEFAMAEHLSRSFPVILRTAEHLLSVLKDDPHSDFRISPNAKRVITFLWEPHQSNLSLPIELDGAQILAAKGSEVFTAYVPNADGPVFMKLIEQTFGKNVTTRTLDTVKKCATA